MSNRSAQPNDLAVLVLAAGKGTRMKSEKAKVLHELAGIPLVAHGLYTCQSLDPERMVVVIGHQADQVQATLDAEFGEGQLRYALQEQQLGTAHAVMAAKHQLEGGPSETYILAGDVPLLSARTLRQMSALKQAQGAAICTLSFIVDDTKGYGRILRDEQGHVVAIREDRDCSPEQKLVKECNSAIYLVDTAFLLDSLGRIDDQNDQGEFYLTDIVELAVADDRRVVGVVVEDPIEILGVNDRSQLAQLEQRWTDDAIERWMLEGNTFHMPRTTALDFHVKIGPNATIEPHCCLKGKTVIGANAYVGAYSYLKDAEIPADEVLAPRTVKGS